MICTFCHARMDVSTIAPFTKAICPNCKNEVTVPARLGTFLLTELLGTGGMGCVYRAHDETLGRDVAIKVMLKSLGDNPEFVSSFRREAQAAAKLNHPSIAQIYSFGQEKGQPYIVMELVPGRHFDQMISSPEPLDVATIMRIGQEIAEGLQLAADANLIHGDIKPENILLDERNLAKLVDFGIAAKPSQGEGEIWGTPYYIAPERVRRQRVDFRSDIYCLGGTLYHAITQHPPFEGADAIEVVRARLKGPPLPLETYRPDVDPAVSAIIMRMLQMEPAMRYPTYGSLLSDMRVYLSRVQPKQSPPSTGKRIMIRGRKSATTGSSATSSPTAYPTQSAGSTGHGNTGSIASRTHPMVITRGMFPDPALPHADAQGKDAAPPGRSAHWKKGCLIAALAFIALLTAGGISAWVFFRHKAKSVAAQMEALHVESTRWQTTLTTTHANIGQGEAALIDFEAKAHAIITQAVACVERELGTNFTARILYDEPEAGTGEIAADVEAADEVADATNVVADTAAAAIAGNETGSTTGAVADAGSPVPQAEEAAAATPPAEAVAEAPEAEPLPPLAQMARDVHQQALPLRTAVRLALIICEKADAIAASARGGTNDLNAVKAAAGQLQSFLESLQAELALAPQVIQETRQKLDLLVRETGRLAADREKAAAEAKRLEEEQRAAADAEARLAAERAAMLAEVSLVAETVLAQKEALLGHQYADVLRELQRLDDQMKRNEGKQALKLATKRVSGLQDLRDFMIVRLNTVPFKSVQGWSVEKAGVRSLTIRSSSGKTDEVPLNKVGVAQMAQFIKFYLQDDQETRALRLRERFAQTINAAIYCLTFGGDSESARAMAKALTQKAVEMMPTERDETLRLLPELAESID